MKNTNNSNNEQYQHNMAVADINQDADVMAATANYKREESQRKVALLFSLMGNIFFLVTAYTILTYDTTGRLFGRLLGINL